MRGTSALLLVSAFLVGGCGSAVSQPTTANSTVSQPASSTASALASSRSRANGSSGLGGRPSGIIGHTVGWDCVVREAARRACRSRPVAARIEVLRAPSGPQIAVVRTDDAGRFRFKVPPGDYTLVSRTSGFVLYARNLALRVRPHQLQRVVIGFFRRHPLPVGPAAGPASSYSPRISARLERFDQRTVPSLRCRGSLMAPPRRITGNVQRARAQTWLLVCLPIATGEAEQHVDTNGSLGHRRVFEVARGIAQDANRSMTRHERSLTAAVNETSSSSCSSSKPNAADARAASVAHPLPQWVRARRQPTSTAGVKWASKRGSLTYRLGLRLGT